jgi:hypothetical protein
VTLAARLVAAARNGGRPASPAPGGNEVGNVPALAPDIAPDIAPAVYRVDADWRQWHTTRPGRTHADCGVAFPSPSLPAPVPRLWLHTVCRACAAHHRALAKALMGELTPARGHPASGHANGSARG